MNYPRARCSQWLPLLALLMMGLACGGGADGVAPTTDADPLALARGTWDVREVLFAQRQPAGIDCSDPNVFHSFCAEADTQAVAVTTGTYALTTTVPGTRTTGFEMLNGSPSLVTIVYVGSTSSARAPCSGKPLTCWTQLPGVPLVPSMLVNEVPVFYAPYTLSPLEPTRIRFAFWLQFNPAYATGQALSFRAAERLEAMTPDRLLVYDSAGAGVYSLHKR